MRRSSASASRSAILFLLSACLVSATVVPQMSLADLARDAKVVYEGSVLRHWTAWDAAHKFLWTHYAMQVTDVLKGQPRKLFTISEPGGTLGGVSMQIADVVQFSDGERVIVFLHITPIGYWRTYGYGQGKFSVRRSGSGDGEQVYTNGGGLTVMDSRGSHDKLDIYALRNFEGMPLDRFKSLVRKLARAAPTAPKSAGLKK